MTPSGTDGDNETEIVYGYARTDPDDPSSTKPRTKTVPADWHESVERANTVLKRVGKEWIERSGVRSVGLSAGRIGDSEDSTSIVVSVDETRTEARTDFPDSVEGVPIETEFVDPGEGYPL